MSGFFLSFSFFIFEIMSEKKSHPAPPSLEPGTSRIQDLDATATPLDLLHTSCMVLKFGSLVWGAFSIPNVFDYISASK